MLSPHHPIPPSEIEAVVPAGFRMMQVMMCSGGYEIEQGFSVAARRKKLIAGMAQRVPPDMMKHEETDD
jgi:hypothetical protein